MALDRFVFERVRQFVAGDAIRKGDRCRVHPAHIGSRFEGEVSLLRDGDVLTTSDWVAITDAEAGQPVTVRLLHDDEVPPAMPAALRPEDV